MDNIYKNTTFSFEFFPPKTDKAEEAFWPVVDELATLAPSFMTVTYGAGGSTRDKTLETVTKMQERTGLPCAMHLTFINTPRKELFALTDDMWKRGIKHIVALRGDMPEGLQWPLDPDGDYFQYTSHFVAALRARHDFEVSVGAYPEKHPDAPDMSADIEALKKKCDAGANRAITQFFFDNDSFFNFVDEVRAAGIIKPIVPGLLPIYDYKSMCSFAGRCGARIPDWLHERFAGLEDKPEEAAKIAQDIFNTQIRNLTERGVEHIHIYTLNKAAMLIKALSA